MIKVVRKGQGAGGAKIYIGRPSPLGNPFQIGRDGNREEVVQKYRRYLWGKILEKDTEIIKALISIRKAADSGDVALECFCAPLPCHGDVIKSAVEWMKKF